MKKITLLPDITVDTEGDPFPLKMRDLLKQLIAGNQEFGKGIEGIKKGIDLLKLLDDNSTELILSDELHQALIRSLKTPINPVFVMRAGEALLNYYEAIQKAEDVN